MQKALTKMLLILAAINLTACSTFSTNVETTQPEVPVQTAEETTVQPVLPTDQGRIQEVNLGKTSTSSELIGGSIEKLMNQEDKVKMSRALEKGTGKTTTWKNGLTGITYTVTPIKKVIIRDHPYCRQYQTTATRGDQVKEVTGTACIADDGNWHTISRS